MFGFGRFDHRTQSARRRIGSSPRTPSSHHRGLPRSIRRHRSPGPRVGPTHNLSLIHATNLRLRRPRFSISDAVHSPNRRNLTFKCSATQSVPASSQGVYGAAYLRVGHTYAGRGLARSQYQHPGYAHGQARGYRGYGAGYGVGAGVAAVAAGALIGGAIASQNQGYYYPDQSYPVYSDPGYQYSDVAPVMSDNAESFTVGPTNCYFTNRLVNPVTQTWSRERVCTTLAP